MPKDHTGLYRVKTFKELIGDLNEILDNVHPFDHRGNPTDDPSSFTEVIKNLESLYVDFPDVDHKVPLFDEIDSLHLIKLKLSNDQS